MYNAHIYIVPVIVFYGAMALPFPLMLALAFFAGFLLDALTVQVIGAQVEISLRMVDTPLRCAGSHHAWPQALVYSRTLGSALCPEWRLHVVHSPRAISDDYISARLASFSPAKSGGKSAGPGLIAMLMAPLVFWFLHWLGRADWLILIFLQDGGFE